MAKYIAYLNSIHHCRDVVIWLYLPVPQSFKDSKVITNAHQQKIKRERETRKKREREKNRERQERDREERERERERERENREREKKDECSVR